MGDLRATTQGRAAGAPAAAAAAAPPPATPALATVTSIPPKRSTVPSTARRRDSRSATSASNHPASGRSIGGAEGARLIALNMALNGTPRDETARYLEQNFELDDQDALLDEVYARVGG